MGFVNPMDGGVRMDCGDLRRRSPCSGDPKQRQRSHGFGRHHDRMGSGGSMGCGALMGSVRHMGDGDPIGGSDMGDGARGDPMGGLHPIGWGPPAWGTGDTRGQRPIEDLPLRRGRQILRRPCGRRRRLLRRHLGPGPQGAAETAWHRLPLSVEGAAPRAMCKDAHDSKCDSNHR